MPRPRIAHLMTTMIAFFSEGGRCCEMRGELGIRLAVDVHEPIFFFFWFAAL